jgi:hypothetical protein
MRIASFMALVVSVTVATSSLPAAAKLPALSDEAKTKAAEAAAKTAWGDKLAGFQLCKAQDRSAGNYAAGMKQAGKDAKPATPTAPCADPGPFVAPGAASTAAAPTAAPASGPAAKKS